MNASPPAWVSDTKLAFTGFPPERYDVQTIHLSPQTITLDPLADPMPDFAPMIHRQRLVVEGMVSEPITAEQICEYLKLLGDVTDMVVLTEPALHQSPLYGWAGWVHWETSGAHFYAWDQPVLFFSVDIYTCKAFDPEDVVRFTQDFFNATKIAARSF